ncbi:MAG: M56 family metallopeptidase [Cyanobacteria bacterium]|nr:M56 family metallopeptidase [Cyanobacteriota bacterium]
MIDFNDFAQQPIVEALAWTLLHFVWQGAVLGFVAFVLLRLARPERASTRYAIGVVTLGLMLMTCVSTFAVLMRTAPAATESGFTIFPISAPGPHQLASVDETINEVTRAGASQSIERTSPSILSTWRPAPLGETASFVLVLAWGIGVLALSLRLLGGWIVTRSLTRHAISTVSPAIMLAAAAIAERLRLRRAVAIVESGAVAVPTLVGWVKPVVLLPAAALSGLSPEQLQAILAHELAHVRRHDYLVNLMQSMIETLLFYHPATWWVSAQVRAEREHCCDDLAVEVCGDRLVYVTALAELTTITSHRAFALAATDGSLVRRVQRILGRPRSMNEPAPAWALLVLFVLLVGGAGTFRSASAEAAVTEEAVTPKSIVTINTAPAIGASTVPAAPVASTKPLEAKSFFSAQWFQAWFDQAPPPPPAPPEAPAAPELASFAPPPPAPPAPPMPSTPPAPPAPPAQEIGTRGGSGNMSWSDGDERISVKWNGAFRLSDDEKDISWMEDGATLTIADGVIFRSQVVLRGVDGRIERTFSKNGTRRDYEPEGRLFLAAAIDKLITRSGMFAKERVAKYLKQGGPDAVMAQIARLGDSSYTHRIYYTELARQAELSDSLLSRILQRVTTEITSNYDKATLFTTILKQPSINDAHRAQIARAAKTISSNYDKRRTLTAVMEVTPLTSSVAAAVLDAAGTIDSNYDRAQVLTEVVERGGVTAANAGTFTALVQSMSSSYDKRRVFTALAASVNVAKEALGEAIKATSSISSSYDQSETLIKLIGKGGLTDNSADAFFQSASQISSPHDLSRTLRTVVDQPSVSPRLLEGVLRTAMKISSSHDRANLLEAVASRHKVTGASRQLYVDATTGMGSFDGNRALAALVRAER